VLSIAPALFRANGLVGGERDQVVQFGQNYLKMTRLSIGNVKRKYLRRFF
jgi:hypothetical protein